MSLSFDPLKTLLRVLLDRFNGQQAQISSLKEIGERLQRYSSLDKLVDSRLVYLEQLTAQQTKQLQEGKLDFNKLDRAVKAGFEKVESKEP